MGSTLATDRLQEGRHDESLQSIVLRLKAAQKSNRGAPAYSRWINRPVGRRVAAVAYKAGRTPNQVTAVSAIVTYTAIALLAVVRPDWWTGAVIAVLLCSGFALDAADGQLARLRGGGSAAGEWLDHVVDCVKTSSLHLAVLICWFRFFHLPATGWLLVPLAFSFEATVFFFSIILSEQLRRAASGLTSASKPHTGERAPALRSVLVLPADYGLMCVLFVVLGAHSVFMWAYAALMVANLILLLGAWPRWFREMKQL